MLWAGTEKYVRFGAGVLTLSLFATYNACVMYMIFLECNFVSIYIVDQEA